MGHGGFGWCGHGWIGFGLGLTTGGTTTGGTTTGGTTTGGTTTGGTTTGGTVTVTGGTVTEIGTPIVTVTGLPLVGGFFVPVPVDPDGEELVTGVPAPEVGGGVTTTVVGATVAGVTVLGAGLADGVGMLVGECNFGTTIRGLPPPAGEVEPK